MTGGRYLVAVLGPTASGKSALGMALARCLGGEIINCDSTAVYRGFDIGTDKPTADDRRAITHHLIDIVDPTSVYTAAKFGQDAANIVDDILARGRWPILVGGSGLYFRALARGLFPGPGADPRFRARLDRVARRRGAARLHTMLQRVDPVSAARITPQDQKRLVRALEVFRITGRPLSDHFEATRSPLHACEVVPFVLRLPAAMTAQRIATRVEAQFRRGLRDEVADLVAAGVPEDARPFGGLVYRQIMDLRRGVRDETATRALVAQENRRYAKRQMTWFRREPNIVWIDGPGESPDAVRRALAVLESRGVTRRTLTGATDQLHAPEGFTG